MSIAVAYMYLLGAILCEVTATISLRLCESFTKFWPSVVVLIGYSLSFYFLSFTLKLIPIGIAYAIWSGLGLILITAIGWVYLRQQLDLPALLGLALILAGVLVINLYSKSVM